MENFVKELLRIKLDFVNGFCRELGDFIAEKRTSVKVLSLDERSDQAEALSASRNALVEEAHALHTHGVGLIADLYGLYAVELDSEELLMPINKAIADAVVKFEVIKHQARLLDGECNADNEPQEQVARKRRRAS